MSFCEKHLFLQHCYHTIKTDNRATLFRQNSHMSRNLRTKEGRTGVFRFSLRMFWLLCNVGDNDGALCASCVAARIQCSVCIAADYTGRNRPVDSLPCVFINLIRIGESALQILLLRARASRTMEQNHGDIFALDGVIRSEFAARISADQTGLCRPSDGCCIPLANCARVTLP